MASPQYPATARPTAPRLAPAPPARPAPSPARRRAAPRIPPRTPRTPSQSQAQTQAPDKTQDQGQTPAPAQAQAQAQGKAQGKPQAQGRPQAQGQGQAPAKGKAPTYAKQPRGKLAAKMGAIKGKMRGKPKPSEIELRMQKGYTVLSDAFSKVLAFCGGPLKFGITLFLTYYLARLVFSLWRIPYHLAPLVPPALAAAVGFALRDANGPAMASKCLKATRGNVYIYEPLYQLVHALHTKQIWLGVSALEVVYVGHVWPVGVLFLLVWQFLYASTIGF